MSLELESVGPTHHASEVGENCANKYPFPWVNIGDYAHKLSKCGPFFAKPTPPIPTPQPGIAWARGAKPPSILGRDKLTSKYSNPKPSC